MRASPDERLSSFFQLVELAEEVYPYVSAARLRALIRSDSAWQPLIGGIAELLRESLAAGYLLTETRTRLSRSGRFSPVRVYRLNRLHPRVAELLDDPDENEPAR
jgi:hypothetical protein